MTYGQWDELGRRRGGRVRPQWIVTAAYLAKAGLDVLVVEAYQPPGGMTSTNPMAPEAPEYLNNEATLQAS